MKKYVWLFGIGAGALVSLLSFVPMALTDQDAGSMAYSQVWGYIIMLVSLSLVWIGLRRERLQNNLDRIPFRKGIMLTLLMSFIASTIYVASWYVLSETIFTDFMASYSQKLITEMEAQGATEKELHQARKEMAYYEDLYQQPWFKVLITYTQILPVALFYAIVGASIESKFWKKGPSVPL